MRNYIVLTKKQVDEIREHYAGDRFVATELAKMYGVSQSCIWGILRWETHNPDKETYNYGAKRVVNNSK